MSRPKYHMFIISSACSKGLKPFKRKFHQICFIESHLLTVVPFFGRLSLCHLKFANFLAILLITFFRNLSRKQGFTLRLSSF